MNLPIEPSSWRAKYMPPDTSYPDELDQAIPGGWWILDGHADPAAERSVPVALRVEHAYGADDIDRAAEVAHATAAALHATTAPAGYRHVVSRWSELVAAVRNTAPRAQCGEVLTGRPGDPPISPDSPPCPNCLPTT